MTAFEQNIKAYPSIQQLLEMAGEGEWGRGGVHVYFRHAFTTNFLQSQVTTFANMIDVWLFTLDAYYFCKLQ